MSVWALVIACGVLVVAIVSAWRTGVYRLPYHDDWAYLRMQDTLDRTGHIVGYGWNDVSLVGQLQIGRLFDLFINDSVLASRLVVILSGFACVWLTWWLIGHSRRPELRSLAVLSFVVFPGVTNVLVTSMTDLPATALMLGCLAAGLSTPRGAGRDRVMRLVPLVAAVALGVGAVTVRQSGVAAPVAVVGVLLLMSQRPESRRRVLVVGAAGAVVALSFLAWRSGIDRNAPTASLEVVRSSALLVRAWSLLGIGLAPLLVATGAVGRWWRTRTDGSRPQAVRTTLTVGPAAWALCALAVGWNQPVVPEALVREGPIGTISFADLGATQSNLFWHLVSLVAAAASALLVAVALAAIVPAVHRLGVRAVVRATFEDPLVVLPLVFAITSFVFSAASSYLQHAVFDRYMFPTLVAGMALVCASRRADRMSTSLEDAAAEQAGNRRRELVGLGLAAVLAVLTIWSLTDWNAYQAARWHAGNALVASGVPVANVDAGFEWVGLHGAVAQPTVQDPGDSYLRVFPNFRRCALVTLDEKPPANMHEIGTERFKAGFGLVTGVLHVYATPEC